MTLTIILPDSSQVEASGEIVLSSLAPPSGRDDISIFPAMTGPASPAGYSAFATSEYSESGFTAAAWRAFDKVNGTDWHSGWSSANAAVPMTLSVRGPVVKTCYSYKVRRRGDLAGFMSVSWSLKDRAGNVLHSVSNFTWGSLVETPYLDVTTPLADSGFDLVVTAISGALCQVDAFDPRS